MARLARRTLSTKGRILAAGMSVAGAYLGTQVMAHMRNTTVRKLFLPIVVYLALSMILRGLGIHLL